MVGFRHAKALSNREASEAIILNGDKVCITTQLGKNALPRCITNFDRSEKCLLRLNFEHFISLKTCIDLWTFSTSLRSLPKHGGVVSE